MGFEYVMSIVGSGMQLQIMLNGAFKVPVYSMLLQVGSVSSSME